MQETWVRSLGWEDPLEKEMATHSSILAWRIPWTEEPGGLQSMGSQRVGHDWTTSLHFQLQHNMSWLHWLGKWCMWQESPLFNSSATESLDVHKETRRGGGKKMGKEEERAEREEVRQPGELKWHQSLSGVTFNGTRTPVTFSECKLASGAVIAK